MYPTAYNESMSTRHPDMVEADVVGIYEASREHQVVRDVRCHEARGSSPLDPSVKNLGLASQRAWLQERPIREPRLRSSLALTWIWMQNSLITQILSRQCRRVQFPCPNPSLVPRTVLSTYGVGREHLHTVR